MYVVVSKKINTQKSLVMVSLPWFFYFYTDINNVAAHCPAFEIIVTHCN